MSWQTNIFTLSLGQAENHVLNGLCFTWNRLDHQVCWNLHCKNRPLGEEKEAGRGNYKEAGWNDLILVAALEKGNNSLVLQFPEKPGEPEIV